MNWIKKSIQKSNNLRDHYKMRDIDIFIKDPLPEGFDPNVVFKHIAGRVPPHLLTNIDIIYVGQFDVFKERDTNALFLDGAIYITNDQSDYDDMIDDIVHEIAHSIEEHLTGFLYDDQQLKREFLGKRERLYHILLNNKYDPPKTIRNKFVYDEKIDMYFYKKIGYDAMWHIITGLFPSPYSCTSLREYFAVGFEEFFLKDRTNIQKNCPILYKKLVDLEYLEDK